MLKLNPRWVVRRKLLTLQKGRVWRNLNSAPRCFLQQQLPWVNRLLSSSGRLRHSGHLPSALSLHYRLNQLLALLRVNVGGHGISRSTRARVRVHDRPLPDSPHLLSHQIPRHVPQFPHPVLQGFPVSWFSKFVRHNMTPSKWFSFSRDAVIVLLLYFGWLGIMVFATPVTVYLHLRKKRASRVEAGFLAFAACFFLCLVLAWLLTMPRP